MTTNFWDIYQAKIHDYIYRRTSDRALTEDLTAQTFLKVIEAHRAGKGPRTSESGWVYRIAHNLVIDHYRARDRQKIVDLDDHLPVQSRTPGEIAEIQIDLEVLDAAMRRLTDDQAQVIQMRFIHGYAFGEIAETMGKTEGAVKALQHRGMETLRVLLQERMRA